MLIFSPWKTGLILAIVLIGLLFSLPNFVSEQSRVNPAGEPSGIWATLPNQTVNLGLDLQGGVHLVFAVDMEEVREERLESLADQVRTALRQQPVILHSRPAVVNGEVVVTITRPEEFAGALERIEDLNEPVTLPNGQQSLDQTLDIRPSEDERTIRLNVSEAAFDAIRQRTVQQSLEVIRRRIATTGTTEPTIARQGSERVLVQVPGETDPEQLKELINTTARMTFHMVEANVDPGPNGTGRTPPGVSIFPADRNDEPFLAVQSRPMVTGDQLESAAQSFDQNGAPAVAFRFNSAGATTFAEVTANNRGRRFAIVLDDRIISAPVIRSPILTGSGIIEGGFTVQSASDLANLLNAGALPARLTAIEERTVGSTLGQDSIERGQTAILIGFGLVIVFMLLAYGFFGVISVVALLANVFLLLGALSGLQATLTLPGIAGIILTIGMAVDANVLIYERIREEYRNGRSVINAIEQGYDRAFAAILDANVTTFIAAAVLYMIGAGPVRGFAVTLGIGILTSVFTAFVFSRLMVATWLRTRRPKTLAI